jgi:hypothetical protein
VNQLVRVLAEGQANCPRVQLVVRYLLCPLDDFEGFLESLGLDDLWIVKVPRDGELLPDSAVSISADLTSNLSSCVSDGLSGILQATKLVKSCNSDSLFLESKVGAADVLFEFSLKRREGAELSK